MVVENKDKKGIFERDVLEELYVPLEITYGMVLQVVSQFSEGFCAQKFATVFSSKYEGFL